MMNSGLTYRAEQRRLLRRRRPWDGPRISSWHWRRRTRRCCRRRRLRRHARREALLEPCLLGGALSHPVGDLLLSLGIVWVTMQMLYGMIKIVLAHWIVTLITAQTHETKTWCRLKRHATSTKQRSMISRSDFQQDAPKS